MAGSTPKQDKRPEDSMYRIMGQYRCCARHWDSQSEPYTGVDSLVGTLYGGWALNPVLTCEEHSVGTRHVVVYHLHLERGHEKATMRVINNPIIERAVTETGLTVIPMVEKHPIDVGTAMDHAH